MNQIIIMYGKLDIKSFVIRIDDLKLYYEDKFINLTQNKIDELLSILTLFKNNDSTKNIIDSIDYDIYVYLNGKEKRYIGNNSNNLNKIKDWLGDLDVR